MNIIEQLLATNVTSMPQLADRLTTHSISESEWAAFAHDLATGFQWVQVRYHVLPGNLSFADTFTDSKGTVHTDAIIYVADKDILCITWGAIEKNISARRIGATMATAHTPQLPIPLATKLLAVEEAYHAYQWKTNAGAYPQVIDALNDASYYDSKIEREAGEIVSIALKDLTDHPTGSR